MSELKTVDFVYLIFIYFLIFESRVKVECDVIYNYYDQWLILLNCWMRLNIIIKFILINVSSN